MLVNLIGGPQQQPVRAMILPTRRRVWLRVLNGAVRIAPTQQELLQQTAGNNDGIPIDPAVGILIDWWAGEMWVISDAAVSALVIGIPGKEPRRFGSGSGGVF